MGQKQEMHVHIKDISQYDEGRGASCCHFPKSVRDKINVVLARNFGLNSFSLKDRAFST